MSTTNDNNDLFQSSHLTLLVSYTIFAIILVIESLLLGWEKWVLLVIIIGRFAEVIIDKWMQVMKRSEGEIEQHMHFDEIYFKQASPAISVNCGPGTFGLLYMEK